MAWKVRWLFANSYVPTTRIGKIGIWESKNDPPQAIFDSAFREENNISYEELKMSAQDRSRWSQWRWKPAIWQSTTERYRHQMERGAVRVLSPFSVKTVHISSNVSRSGSHTILVFAHTHRYGNIPTGTPLTGRRMQRGMKIRPISRFISELIGNRTQAFEWYQFQ